MSAFDRLMKTARRDSKKSTQCAQRSQFFPCPAGCGRNVTERSINDHLDTCPKLTASSGDCGVAVACGEMVHPSTNDKQSTDCSQQRVDTVPEECNGSQQISSDDAAPTKRRKVQDDAFAHMLKNSSKVYSALEKHTAMFAFHLNEDLTVTWSSVTDDSKSDSTCWAESLSLKNLRVASTAKDDDGKLPPNQVVELALTSSIPSARAALPRLVAKHSRLHPSHLKSCLQKSLRRRSGEQAVRVAMELIDRAYDQFIRRLPIIILEDSALHPDFGMLVWLMIAESKVWRRNMCSAHCSLC